MQLLLMTTAGCHLCEQALLILQQLGEHRFFTLELVDIAADDHLIEKYGVRIPVVVKKTVEKNTQQDTGKELGWPFTLEQLDAFFFPENGQTDSD